MKKHMVSILLSAAMITSVFTGQVFAESVMEEEIVEELPEEEVLYDDEETSVNDIGGDPGDLLIEDNSTVELMNHGDGGFDLRALYGSGQEMKILIGSFCLHAS